MTTNRKVQELLKVLGNAPTGALTADVTTWAHNLASQILDEQGLAATLPKATQCTLSVYHRPKVTRYINHHIQPQAAGGYTVPDNIAQLCDNCHMTVHAVMWELHMMLGGQMASTATLGSVPIGSKRQKELGRQGYNKCVLAGTSHLIPKEG